METQNSSGQKRHTRFRTIDVDTLVEELTLESSTSWSSKGKHEMTQLELVSLSPTFGTSGAKMSRLPHSVRLLQSMH